MLDIRGSGSAFVLISGGLPLPKRYDSHKAAVAAERGVLRRLQLTALQSCLSCGQGFRSTGRGNRLCGSCRSGA